MENLYARSVFFVKDAEEFAGLLYANAGIQPRLELSVRKAVRGSFR
jgi:hypothetical protein